MKKKPYDSVPDPVVLSSTFTFEDSDEIIRHTEGQHERPDREEYGRYGNPTSRAVEQRMAALEGTEDAVLFSSGMAAVSTTLMALLSQGQHVVLFGDCYRMTRELVERQLARFGVQSTILAACDLAGLASALRPETRVVVGESPTNPYLRCVDLEKLVAICKGRRGLKTVVDATFATPINCRPASYGVDIVVHSATKYLGGHHDVLGGFVCASQPLCSVVRDLRGVVGNVADPHAAFLIARGMKTLALRVAQQNQTALAVARWLEGKKQIARVHYPGLPSHPDHDVARRQMSGFGGVVSFVMAGGFDAARSLVDRLEIPAIAPSFGGTESLVEQPAVMSYYEMSSAERSAIGIEDGLVRYAVGVEPAETLIADLDRALEERKS